MNQNSNTDYIFPLSLLLAALAIIAYKFFTGAYGG